jgi:L-serine/L-threonine ammonia-lyase
MNTIHHNTPLLKSNTLSQHLNSSVWLKLDALQPSGSFKARGIGFACQHYKAQGARLFISSSGGNAGLAVAYSGRQLNVPVKVVVPTTTKPSAIEMIESEGAQVIVKGEHWLQAHEYAMSLVDDQSAYLHPFDDPLIWQGHSSIIQEVLDAGVEPDCVVLSVGGGGLYCGIVEGLQRAGLEHVPILAMETRGADSFYQAVQSNSLITLDGISSIATSLGATQVAEQALKYSQSHPTINEIVDDHQAVEACLTFLDQHRVLVEPACGASLAAIYENSDFFQDKENILMIVCGGVGVSIEQLQMMSESFKK